jgi:hypothetical protein
MNVTQIARSYDRYLAALWRGENVGSFGAWLSAHWSPVEGPEPVGPPAAFSPHGGGGRGIRWYQTPTSVVGYVSGFPHGCYRIPATDSPPAIASAGEPAPLQSPRTEVPVPTEGQPAVPIAC